MLLPLLLLLAMLVCLALLVVAGLQFIARQRKARDKAHILQRVANLEEQRE